MKHHTEGIYRISRVRYWVAVEGFPFFLCLSWSLKRWTPYCHEAVNESAEIKAELKQNINPTLAYNLYVSCEHWCKKMCLPTTSETTGSMQIISAIKPTDNNAEWQVWKVDIGFHTAKVFLHAQVEGFVGREMTTNKSDPEKLYAWRSD